MSQFVCKGHTFLTHTAMRICHDANVFFQCTHVKKVLLTRAAVFYLQKEICHQIARLNWLCLEQILQAVCRKGLSMQVILRTALIIANYSFFRHTNLTFPQVDKKISVIEICNYSIGGSEGRKTYPRRKRIQKLLLQHNISITTVNQLSQWHW